MPKEPIATQLQWSSPGRLGKTLAMAHPRKWTTISADATEFKTHSLIEGECNNSSSCILKTPWIGSQLARRNQKKLVFGITDFHDFTQIVL